jgi:hypothetical protein
MNRTDLDNGVALLYNGDLQGKVVFQFPDGSQVRTTWGQLSRLPVVIDQLRQAYECLLQRAGTDADLPVDTLMRMDDLLFSLRIPHQGPGTIDN